MIPVPVLRPCAHNHHLHEHVHVQAHMCIMRRAHTAHVCSAYRICRVCETKLRVSSVSLSQFRVLVVRVVCLLFYNGWEFNARVSCPRLRFGMGASAGMWMPCESVCGPVRLFLVALLAQRTLSVCLVCVSNLNPGQDTRANKQRNEHTQEGTHQCAFVCCCFACGFVLLLEVFRVRFARVSCPRLRFVVKP